MFLKIFILFHVKLFDLYHFLRLYLFHVKQIYVKIFHAKQNEYVSRGTFIIYKGFFLIAANALG